jgi:predicted protein tyrosine phosphatase
VLVLSRGEARRAVVGFQPPHSWPLGFLGNWTRGWTRPGIVHCGAGISRSSAAAVVMLAALGKPGAEAEAVEIVAESVRQACERGFRGDDFILPNRRLVDLGDHVLGRGGRLLQATEAYFAPRYSSRSGAYVRR